MSLCTCASIYVSVRLLFSSPMRWDLGSFPTTTKAARFPAQFNPNFSFVTLYWYDQCHSGYASRSRQQQRTDLSIRWYNVAMSLSWRFLVQFGLTYLAWSYPAAIRLSDVFSPPPPPRQVSTPFVFVCRHADVVEFVLSNRQTQVFVFLALEALAVTAKRIFSVST